MSDTPAEKTRTTDYYVLEQTGESGGTFSTIGAYKATGAADALRQAGQNAGTGTYVAVPARSFVPTKVTVENKPTIRLG